MSNPHPEKVLEEADNSRSEEALAKARQEEREMIVGIIEKTMNEKTSDGRLFYSEKMLLGMQFILGKISNEDLKRINNQ